MPDKPKMSHAETEALDVSAVYQMGKVAHQRGVPLVDNPWIPETQFFVYWEQGWKDDRDLQPGNKDEKGYQG